MAARSRIASCERIAATFCDKDQMSIKRINDMSSPSNIGVI
jgi:hypothetical protein